MGYNPKYFDYIENPKKRAHAKKVGKARYFDKKIKGQLAEMGIYDLIDVDQCDADFYF